MLWALLIIATIIVVYYMAMPQSLWNRAPDVDLIGIADSKVASANVALIGKFDRIEDCEAAAEKAGYNVYVWIKDSHECYGAKNLAPQPATNIAVISGVRRGLTGNTSAEHFSAEHFSVDDARVWAQSMAAGMRTKAATVSNTLSRRMGMERAGENMTTNSNIGTFEAERFQNGSNTMWDGYMGPTTY